MIFTICLKMYNSITTQQSPSYHFSYQRVSAAVVIIFNQIGWNYFNNVLKHVDYHVHCNVQFSHPCLNCLLLWLLGFYCWIMRYSARLYNCFVSHIMGWLINLFAVVILICDTVLWAVFHIRANFRSQPENQSFSWLKLFKLNLLW